MIKGEQKSYLLRGDGAEVTKNGGGLGAHHFSKCGWTIMYLHPPPPPHTLLLEKAAWKQKLFNKARDTRVLRVLLQSNNLYLIFCLSLVLKLVSHFRSFLEAFPTSTFLDHLQRLPLPFWSTSKAPAPTFQPTCKTTPSPYFPIHRSPAPLLPVNTIYVCVCVLIFPKHFNQLQSHHPYTEIRHLFYRTIPYMALVMLNLPGICLYLRF